MNLQVSNTGTLYGLEVSFWEVPEVELLGTSGVED